MELKEKDGYVMIPVSKTAVEHGLKLGKKVYLDKIDFPDKFHIGGASELQADIYGFIAESAVCEFFNVEKPKFFKQKNDEYDLIINDLRVDVKKVGFDRRTKKPRITLNKKQFYRKKTKIDAFFFVTFKGGFQQATSNGFQIWYPIPEISYLAVLGWISSSEVEAKSKTYVWKDKMGKPIDESFSIKENVLRNVKELMFNEQKDLRGD